MPRQVWPLLHDRPSIQIVLPLAPGAQPRICQLLADTGAGTARSGIDLVLDENNCLDGQGSFLRTVRLGGSYRGSYPLCVLRVQIPALGFGHDALAVGVSRVPAGFDGLACFQFLNRFAYGNFGDPSQFGLEV
jgi:hypothetical protein